jgi:hypothetical protein
MKVEEEAPMEEEEMPMMMNENMMAMMMEKMEEMQMEKNDEKKDEDKPMEDLADMMDADPKPEGEAAPMEDAA